MNTKLKISEYMSSSLLKIQGLLKLLLSAMAVGVVVLFGREMNSLAEQRYQYQKLDAGFESYEQLMEKAEENRLEGNYIEGEACYRKAMELLPQAKEPYCGLAELFCEVREYEAALQVLLEFPAEPENTLQEQITLLQAQIEELQQSIWVAR